MREAPSDLKNKRSITMPTAAIVSAATGSDNAHDPVAWMTDSAT